MLVVRRLTRLEDLYIDKEQFTGDFMSQARNSARSILAITTALLVAQPSEAESDKLSNIRTVAVISLLGNEVDMQTQGTRFDYADYKLHADWNFDTLIRDYVTKAVGDRFTIKNDAVHPQLFHDVKNTAFDSVWSEISDRLKAVSQKPEVDAVIVVYPNATDTTGFVSPGLAVTHSAPFLFNKGATNLAATYGVGIYDAKTGSRIDYGTPKVAASGYIFGNSPPWEGCPNTIWADSEDKLTVDQKKTIRQELWSLITRSMPHALLNAGLISKAQADVLDASAVPADPSCGPFH